MGARVAGPVPPPINATGVPQAAVDEDVIDRGYLTMNDAESFLFTFKTKMTEHFP
ncbi:hypothetical protein FQN49_007511, partial [Arthroderma sp. PD_2]